MFWTIQRHCHILCNYILIGSLEMFKIKIYLANKLLLVGKFQPRDKCVCAWNPRTQQWLPGFFARTARPRGESWTINRALRCGGTSVWRKSEAFHKGGNLKAGKVRLMVVKLRVAGTFFDGWSGQLQRKVGDRLLLAPIISRTPASKYSTRTTRCRYILENNK